MIIPGKNFEGQKGFPTPTNLPDKDACRVFRLPDNDEWLGVLMGAVLPLTHAYNWFDYGAMSTNDAADAWWDIIQAAYAESLIGVCPTNMVEAPYWDTATDSDDNAPVDSQVWYGEVTNSAAAPDSLTWFENAAIWTFTGLLAVSGTPAAALAFNTVAPRFVLAQRAGDVAEVIRIVVDAQDIATVDTTGRSGEIIETEIVADPANSTHQIYVIKVS